MKISETLQVEIDRLLARYSYRNVTVNSITLRQVEFFVNGREIVFHRNDDGSIKKLHSSKMNLDVNLEAQLQAQTILLTQAYEKGLKKIEERKAEEKERKEAQRLYLESLDRNLIKHQGELINDDHSN